MMRALRLSELQSSMPGALQGQLNGDASFNRICTDTRHLNTGELFVALSGEHFNGNNFALKAAELGAVALVVSEQQATTLPQWVVNDTQLALAHIAAMNRQQFNGPLIALTGSAGKTSTKDMLAAILSECGEVLATAGNFNNEIGVPLTLLNLSSEHCFAVIEMGAAKAGDISYLCQFAKPNIAIVTNAGSAHLEGFGSVDVIAKTKGAIFESLAADGIAIINVDDVFAEQWLAQAGKAGVKTFSVGDDRADVFAAHCQPAGVNGWRFDLCANNETVAIELPLLGQHNIANALAAAAAAIAAGASLQQVQAGLAKVRAVDGRLNLHSINEALTVIDDSYNANPDSVKAAIDVLAELGPDSCLVLGNMGELGPQAVQLHHDIGAYAGEKNIKQLITLGPSADAVAAGFGGHAIVCKNHQQVIEACRQQCQQGVVLVKGSRSAAMENVVAGLVPADSNAAMGEFH